MIRALRLCFVFALLAVPAFAQTAATRATLYTEIDTLFADTGADPITPAQLRQSLENITASSANLLSDTTLTVLDGFTISSAGSITLTPGGSSGVRLNGMLGVSTASVANINLVVAGTPGHSTGTTYGLYGGTTAAVDTTAALYQFYSNPRTTASAFNLTLLSHFRAALPTIGSGSSITTQEGFTAASGMTGASTNNFGFRGLLASDGTKNFNLYMDGTAPSYIAGEFRIGSASDLGAYPLQVTGASIFTGAVTLNSTVNKLTITPPATGSTLTIADGKTLTASNTLTLTATDGSTLAIGAGGTLGTAAYTAASAYATSAQGTKADNVGAVNGLVKSNGSASFSAASAGTDYVVPAGNVATATALATPRAIYGNNFDGSAALTQVIASTYGGTGNGFAKFSGPTTSEKTFTLPDATATILTSNAAVTVAQGGTGATTLTANNVLLGNGTTAVQFVAPGDTGNVLTSNGTTWTSAAPTGGGGDVSISGTPSSGQVATWASSSAIQGVDTLTKAQGGTNSTDYTTATETFTNKRITPRIATLTDAATVTPATDSYDGGILTSLSQTTDFINPTGTPTDGQRYMLRIKSTTTRTLTWTNGGSGTQYRASSDLALPTATTGSSKTDYLVFIWNAADSKWDLVGRTFGF